MVLSSLPESRVFYFKEVASLFGSSGLSRTLSSLVKKKKLQRVKRGVFISSGTDEWGKALALGGKGSYLGFATALFIHKLVDEYPNTVFVVSRNRSTTIKSGVLSYKIVNLGDRAVGSVSKDFIRVSSLAKTFFDCFYMPEYAGGLPRVITAFKRARFSKNDWSEFFYYLRDYGSFCLRMRVCFFVESFFGGEVPKKFLNEFKPDSYKTVCFFDSSASRKGRFVKEWSLIANGVASSFGV